MLAVIETHPVQYHAPVYRSLQQDCGVPVTAIYGSDFSVSGYQDREFGARFAWDTDLLSGYTSVFLSKVAQGGPAAVEALTTTGLSAALRQVNPTALLLLGYSPRFYRVACRAALAGRRPLLFRGETTDHAASRSRWKAWLRDRALRWFYARCGRLLYVGQRSRQHYERLGVLPERLGFSPYCVDTSAFALTAEDRARLRLATRADWGVGDPQRVLLFSGKLSWRKGPDLLIEAVRALPEAQRARVVLAFLGDGALRCQLAEAAARAPRVEARFLGFQNQKRLSAFYHAADALVLPSRLGETWGLVVNDALHHGLPCVVSDKVGCAPDLIVPGQTGEVCAAGSVPALTAALQRALPWTDQPSVAQACREQVSRYTVAHAAEGIARAYREVTLGPRSP
jgi:glycosyltransferase involved in cell wall biosynthesis